MDSQLVYENFNYRFDAIFFTHSCALRRKTSSEPFSSGARTKPVLLNRWLTGTTKNVSAFANTCRRLFITFAFCSSTVKCLLKRSSQPVLCRWSWSWNVTDSQHCNRIRCKAFRQLHPRFHRAHRTLTRDCSQDFP